MSTSTGTITGPVREPYQNRARIHNRLPVHRSLHSKALSWILDKTGAMKRPLEAQVLMAAARRRTGLDDFGDEAFHEPLSRLLNSCQKEARLNSVGKLVLTKDILQLLINRLEIQRDRYMWPGVSKVPIIAPLFITGLPRTGTTLLHNLLAQDHDEFCAPTTWEVMFPSPPPSVGQRNRHRIKRAERNLAWFDRLVPEFRKIHPMAACFPQECVAIMSHSFMSDQFDTMFTVPAYQSWIEKEDMRPAYGYHRLFLQHLQYGKPVRRFVLKAPVHMVSIEAIFAVYPDARVVQLHREPLEVLPSIASLTTVLRGTFSDFADPVAIGHEMTNFWENALEKYLRARRALSAEAFIDLNFSDLVCDPIALICKLYRKLGRDLSSDVAKRMRAFLGAHPNGQHGTHSYALTAFGLDPVKVGQRFGAYRELFGLPGLD